MLTIHDPSSFWEGLRLIRLLIRLGASALIALKTRYFGIERIGMESNQQSKMNFPLCRRLICNQQVIGSNPIAGSIVFDIVGPDPFYMTIPTPETAALHKPHP